MQFSKSPQGGAILPFSKILTEQLNAELTLSHVLSSALTHRHTDTNTDVNAHSVSLIWDVDH